LNRVETSSAWHQLTGDQVLLELKSGDKGLSNSEAERRLQEVGLNELSSQGTRSAWLILWEQLTGFMVLVLISAAAISAIMGDLKDAIAIGAIVVLNAVLGFSQEYRAEQAMAALKRLTVPVARVKRDGAIVEISSTQLVPGDILFLEAGTYLAADCRLLEASHLQVQEAALTGESEPALKETGELAAEGLALGDRRNMAYRGTFVSAGRGLAVVTDTGMRTELGKIATLIHAVKQEQTPLQMRLDELGKSLAGVALAIVAVIFVLGLLRGEELKLMLLTAVSIGVAAVPEGLPAVVTIALTLGAQRMLKRNVLVRRLAAVETLGSITVICSDKTGTLTQNRMTVEHLKWAGRSLDLRNPGETAASVGQDGLLLLLGGTMCNDTAPGPEVIGDPTEVALTLAARRFGMEREALEQWLPRIEEKPFDAVRKRMTTVHQVVANDREELALLRGCDRVAFTKGSADGLLEISTKVWSSGAETEMDPAWRDRIEAAERSLVERGMRVLGVALRRLDAGVGVEIEELEQGLTFVGMVGIIDPPRKEAALAVETCRSAGIRGLMITGDHPGTAKFIAAELGMAGEGRVITGAEIEHMPLEELEELAQTTTVYARVSPEHKLRIVDALQNRGQIAAMTGDGVNDAPALKKADIGIAMGITGTDVAKEAADMVLLDDNFASIVAAVEEGRVIYDNIRKFIKYMLATNAGEIVLMVLAPLAGMPLPLLPLQILWLNLVTDGLPALALGVEPAETNVMRQNPRRPDESIFARGLGLHIAWVGILMGLLCLGTGYWYWRQGIAEWQTVLFTTLTFSQMAHVLAIHREAPASIAGLWRNPMLLAAVALTVTLQLALLYVDVFRGLFGTLALAPREVAVSIGVSAVVFVAVELEKRLSPST
jgi:Ca2+-transporting ATPase